MIKESITKQFAKYVSLNIFSMLGMSLYIFADTFFVANGVPNNGLAALNIALPVFSFMSGVALMIAMGGATLYAIIKSGGDHENANKVFTHVFIIGVLIGIIFCIIGNVFPNQLGRLMGSNDQLLDMVSTYIRTILTFAPFFMINNILVAFVRNDGNPKLAMFSMLAGCLGNIIFDYIFVFPAKMGIFGAALATGFSPIIGLILLSTHFIRKKNGFKLVTAKLKGSIYAKIVSLGFPSFVTDFSSGMVILLFNREVYKITGTLGVSAYAIVANLALIAISIFNGIAQGTQPLLSYAYGSKNKSDILKILKMTLITTAVTSGVVYGTIALLPELIIGIFNSTGSVALLQMAKKGLYIYFISLFFSGLNIVSTVFFSSLDKSKSSSVISMLRGFAAVIPLLFIFANLFGMTGIWLVMPAAEFVTLCVTSILLIKFLKKNH